jgi:hypothetical protein
MVHVVSSQRLCGVEGKDGLVDVMGCVGSFYPKIVVFYVLRHMANLVFLVFWLAL